MDRVDVCCYRNELFVNAKATKCGRACVWTSAMLYGNERKQTVMRFCMQNERSQVARSEYCEHHDEES
jgi:hypothetical protein